VSGSGDFQYGIANFRNAAELAILFGAPTLGYFSKLFLHYLSNCSNARSRWRFGSVMDQDDDSYRCVAIRVILKL